jgi:transposase
MKHKESILRLRAEGKSYREIQKELGCSKSTIAYHCGEGQKEKMNRRQTSYRRKIKRFLDEYKESRGCLDCKGMYPYWMLDFDHLKDKKFTIAEFRSSSLDLEEIKTEVEKCEVVCANCHRMRTHLRKN